MKKIISFLLLIFLIFSLFACGNGNGKIQPRSKTISSSYFNTLSVIYAYADIDGSDIEKYSAIAEEILSYYHKLFDIYFEYADFNNVRTINKNAGKTPVKVNRDLIDFLLYCKELYTLTGGKTNVMLGSVLKIWHDLREDAEDDFGYLDPSELPSEDILSEAATHTSIDLLVINEEESTVYISDPKASLDVGAIAKGYTVDILYDKLKSAGADSVALNIGGNLRTIGLKPDSKPWVTGITNPDKDSDDTVKCKIEIEESSVVTSGDYERFFTSGNKRYHHIIDPETLMPAEYFASVSIITTESALADTLSTALFCMPYDDGLALAESIEGVEVIWIYKDGTLKYTDGIRIAK
jgi:thiamine biosynthesis lipoprotein